MRHTNLSSAVKRAKELAKKNGKSHYANGASGRYRVSDKKPEDSSFVQATPSGGEWSHKMNQATKTFTKSRIFGGVTMEAVEQDWEQESSMKEILEKFERLDEAKLTIKKVQAMTDEQRDKIGPRDKVEFHTMQYKPTVMKIADKVAQMVNAEGKKLKIVTWAPLTGKLEDHPYPTQGLLEKLIHELQERV